MKRLQMRRDCDSTTARLPTGVAWRSSRSRVASQSRRRCVHCIRKLVTNSEQTHTTAAASPWVSSTPSEDEDDISCSRRHSACCFYLSSHTQFLITRETKFNPTSSRATLWTVFTDFFCHFILSPSNKVGFCRVKPLYLSLSLSLSLFLHVCV